MYSITVDFSELENLALAMERMPVELDAVLNQAMTDSEILVHETMATEPAPIPFPPSQVHWDSEKQRRAYHLNQGWGGGDPYIRAGKLDAALENTTPLKTGEGWFGSVVALGDWVHYVLGNNQGQDQSSIHEGRFPTIPTIGQQARPRVVEIFQAAVTNFVQNFKLK